MTFSRETPSPRYVDLLAQYRTLHEKGDQLNDIPPEKTFNGISLMPHVEPIKALIGRFGVRSLLDYGAGKAEAYEQLTFQYPDGRTGSGLKAFWELDEIALYDPGYLPYSALPERRFDAVISTDMLEHCPEEDIDWILDEIFGFATKFVFLTVAVYPAKKKLPTGENAHITVKSPGWWLDKLEAARKRCPGPHYFLVVIHADNRKQFIEG